MAGGSHHDGPSAFEIARMLDGQAESLGLALFPNAIKAGGMLHIGSVRGEPGDSLKIQLRGARPGSWADYALAESDPAGKGDMLKLVKLAMGFAEWGEAVRWAKGWLGIESMDPAALDRQRARADAARQRQELQAADEIKRSALKARNMWLHGAPLIGTPAQRYLENRGIDFAMIGRLPGALRFRHDIHHAEWQRALPALLTAGIGPDGTHCATHATYLERAADGSWGKVPNWTDGKGRTVKCAKKIFGKGKGHHFPISKGSSGKPLRRMPAGEAVYVSEGLEDALTYAMLHPECRIVMAGTLGNIGALELPQQCGDLVLLAQRDAPGSDAAATMEKVIEQQQLRARQDGSGRRVLCVWPAEGFKDFNDELLGKVM